MPSTGTFIVLALLVGLAVVYLAPGFANTVFQMYDFWAGLLLGVLGLLVALYFISTGVWFLVIIGFLGLVIGVWRLVFDDSFGWLRAFIPGV